MKENKRRFILHGCIASGGNCRSCIKRKRVEQDAPHFCATGSWEEYCGIEHRLLVCCFFTGNLTSTLLVCFTTSSQSGCHTGVVKLSACFGCKLLLLLLFIIPVLWACEEESASATMNTPHFFFLLSVYRRMLEALCGPEKALSKSLFVLFSIFSFL